MTDRIAGRVEVVGVGGFHLGDHGIERSRHVGPGVAVGNRVHVQPIECAGVLSNRVAKRDDELAQRVGAEPFQCGHGIGV